MKTFTRAQLGISLSSSSSQAEVLKTVNWSSLIQRQTFPLPISYPMSTFHKGSVHWRRFEKFHGIIKEVNSCLFHFANKRSQPICKRSEPDRSACCHEIVYRCVLRLWDDSQLSTVWFILSILHPKYIMSDINTTPMLPLLNQITCRKKQFKDHSEQAL